MALKNYKFAIAVNLYSEYDINKGIFCKELTKIIYERIGDLRLLDEILPKDLSKILGIQTPILSRIERGETKAISNELVIKLQIILVFQ